MSIRRSLKSLVVASLFTTSVANAATSDTVGLSGAVESTLTVSAGTPVTAAMNLPLDGAAAFVEQIILVANITSSTNDAGGLTLTATSGSLEDPVGAVQPIAYKVSSVAAGAGAPASGAFTDASGTNYTTASTGAGSWNRDLYINYTPAALQNPGTYVDTITLTVADN